MSTLPSLQKVKWFDDISESGIQIVGAPIEREGILLGMQLIPKGNGLILVAIVRRMHDNNIVILDSGSFQFVD